MSTSDLVLGLFPVQHVYHLVCSCFHLLQSSKDTLHPCISAPRRASVCDFQTPLLYIYAEENNINLEAIHLSSAERHSSFEMQGGERWEMGEMCRERRDGRLRKRRNTSTRVFCDNMERRRYNIQ